MISNVLFSFIAILQVLVQSSLADSNSIEWTACNSKVDRCLNFIKVFIQNPMEIKNPPVCDMLFIHNVSSLHRSGEAASRPCEEGSEGKCSYEKLELGFRHLHLNCTLKEGFPELLKFFPGVRIPVAPSEIPTSFLDLWGAKPALNRPTSIFAHWEEASLKVELMIDRKNKKYPFVETKVVSSDDSLTVWCEGGSIYRTLCESASGFDKTRRLLGNIAQVFVKRMVKDLIKDNGKELAMMCVC